MSADQFIQIGTTECGEPIFRRRGPADDSLDAMKGQVGDWLQASWTGTDLQLTRTGKVKKHPVSPDTMSRFREMLTVSELSQAEDSTPTGIEARLVRIEAMLKALVQKHG